MTIQGNKFERNFGINKGKRRLWLEGNILQNSGFTHGDRWDIVSSTNNAMTIMKNPAGKKKIAGKPKKDGSPRPIIDMAGSTITNVFADSTARVLVTNPCDGLLIITGIV